MYWQTWKLENSQGVQLMKGKEQQPAWTKANEQNKRRECKNSEVWSWDNRVQLNIKSEALLPFYMWFLFLRYATKSEIGNSFNI